MLTCVIVAYSTRKLGTRLQQQTHGRRMVRSPSTTRTSRPGCIHVWSVPTDVYCPVVVSEAYILPRHPDSSTDIATKD